MAPSPRWIWLDPSAPVPPQEAPRSHPEDLTRVVDGEMHMLTALPLAVQADEALGAEQIHTILAKHGSIVVLTLQAHEAIDDTLQVISQVWPRSIPGMNMHEAFIGVEKSALHTLTGCNTILKGGTDELLHI